jgi:DNA mismatch endonuclease (patch repair protein)
VANRSKRWAVFVHGCYWHHHAGCQRATVPTRNRAFWLEKFLSNRRRDRRVVSELKARGFTVAVIWECEMTKPQVLARKLSPLFRVARRRSG